MAIRTIHVGLGTIGQAILRATVSSGIATPVAGVDPAHAGERLAAFTGGPSEAVVQPDLAAALGHPADVAIVSTASAVPDLMATLRPLIASGCNVVSTCEKLCYPWLETPELATEIDDLAHRHGVTVVGTGINPGFLLDALPVFLRRPVVSVRAVRATRTVNTARRRRQLQEKTGAGLAPEEFARKAAEGSIGHVGLAESAALVCRGLGWPVPETIDVRLEPVIADQPVMSEIGTVEAGMVRGQVQTVQLAGPEGQSLSLRLLMALGETDEADEILIDGDPPVHARLIGGVFGDTATAGCTANIIPQVVAARPGLLTVLDLPLC